MAYKITYKKRGSRPFVARCLNLDWLFGCLFGCLFGNLLDQFVQCLRTAFQHCVSSLCVTIAIGDAGADAP